MRKREFKWESVTALGTLFLAIGTLIMAIVMSIQVKDARDMDRAKNLIDLRKEFNSSEFLSLRRSLATQRLDQAGHLIPWKSNEAPSEAYEILNFLDYVGMLLDRGHLDAEDVWEEMSYWISSYGADLKDVIEEERKSDPDAYRDFSKLVKEMEKIGEQQYKEAPFPPKENLEEFYNYERKNPLFASPLPQKHKR